MVTMAIIPARETAIEGNLMLRGKDPGENTDVARAYCSRFPTLVTSCSYHICWLLLITKIFLPFPDLRAPKGKVEYLSVWLTLCPVIDPSNVKVSLLKES